MQLLTLLPFLLPLISAAPIATPDTAAADLSTRQSSGSYCGNTYYSASALSDAVNAGYDDYYNNYHPGNYPHTYNDYEGFTFAVDGPYQEFPIKSNGATYNGGSPGADRVIFNTDGEYAGSITHQGASGNNFVGCSDTS